MRRIHLSTNYLLNFPHLSLPSSKLFDRISSTVVSPSRAPPGDGISRCRDTVEAVATAPGHKYNRERNELLQLLSLPHLQVITIYNLNQIKRDNIF